MTAKPNIVVILLDAIRADRFSCYGHERETTPFLDSLASEGTRYEQAYSTTTWSLPAYVSLFTGDLPVDHGAVDWGSNVGENPLTSSLHDEYTSFSVSPHILSGEWGMATEFDEYAWAPVPHKELLFDPDPVIDELRNRDSVGWRDFIDVWTDNPTLRTFPNAVNQVLKNKKYDWGFWDDSGAQNVLNGVTDEMLDTTPFFLFMNFVETHKPYIVPRKWARKYTDASPSDINRVNNMNLEAATAGDIDVSPEDQQLLLDLVDGSLRYMDEQLKQFYQRLDEQGVADNTVFVVLSDHGDLFGEWGVWEHQAVIHRKLCQVPLIINAPWDTPDTVTRPTSIRDLYKASIDISHGEKSIPEGSDAVFVEYKGWDTNPELPPPWEQYNLSAEPWKWYRASCVTDDWRLCWRADDHVELYAIEDEKEKTDVADSEPDVVDDLQRRIEDRIGHPSDIHELYQSDDPHKMSDEIYNRLEELGYM